VNSQDAIQKEGRRCLVGAFFDRELVELDLADASTSGRRANGVSVLDAKTEIFDFKCVEALNVASSVSPLGAYSCFGSIAIGV